MKAFRENSQRLLAIDHFRKNAPSQMFDRIWNTIFFKHTKYINLVLLTVSSYCHLTKIK